ncbi:hypothetical protein VB773_20545 [Haloarculaceae archaeon H-GB2-1]|nr:hypothetical protein [Haloarculaceae archaeon H-GB11]MEA5409729.1 hypothetical protein [Haloarculaceae archaeon H-GB2-1]
MVQEISERLLVNSRTWLKRLHRRDGIIGLLPPIFYLLYQLCAVRIAEESEQVIVDLDAIKKPSPGTEELTLTELLLTLGQNPKLQFLGRAVLRIRRLNRLLRWLNERPRMISSRPESRLFFV